ncbi:MAG: hypothetical protein Q8M94_13565 [Ignavibacteria bacterium]|nr:hypothetical protein [Ignavibacteria bacterium]
MLFEHTKCKKCNHINPAYKYICEECKSYLREKIVNIDLWNTIQQIIEEPFAAFKQIIFAEHKNFVIFLIFLIGTKNLIISRFLSVPQLGSDGVTNGIAFSLFLSIIFSIITFLLLTVTQTKVYKKKGIHLRFKDIYATNIYAFIPYIFGLIFIFPVELTVLGGNIFSNNPYSFQIKPTVSYILFGIEGIVLIWSLILVYKGTFLVVSNRIFALFLTSSFFVLWFLTVYLSSKIIFTF